MVCGKGMKGMNGQKGEREKGRIWAKDKITNDGKTDKKRERGKGNGREDVGREGNYSGIREMKMDKR